MRKSHKALAVVAATGIIFAAGTAYTASNSVPSSTVGYGTATVSGGTVNSIAYNLSSDGTTVSSVNLVLAGDTHLSTVSIALSSGSTPSSFVACTAGTPTTSTPYTCDVTSLSQSTASLAKTAVLVN